MFRVPARLLTRQVSQDSRATAVEYFPLFVWVIYAVAPRSMMQAGSAASSSSAGLKAFRVASKICIQCDFRLLAAHPAAVRVAPYGLDVKAHFWLAHNKDLPVDLNRPGF